jgi:hypothetical protein
VRRQAVRIERGKESVCIQPEVIEYNVAVRVDEYKPWRAARLVVELVGVSKRIADG